MLTGSAAAAAMTSDDDLSLGGCVTARSIVEDCWTFEHNNTNIVQTQNNYQTQTKFKHKHKTQGQYFESNWRQSKTKERREGKANTTTTHCGGHSQTTVQSYGRCNTAHTAGDIRRRQYREDDNHNNNNNVDYYGQQATTTVSLGVGTLYSMVPQTDYTPNVIS